MSHISLAVVLLSWALFPIGLRAQAGDVLRQLSTVDVRIRLEGAARDYPGLDARELAEMTRARLREAGLEVTDVVTGPAGGQAPIFEILLVMYADSARAKRYAFSLTATLTEGVTIRRGDPRRVWAQTWNGGATVGIVGTGGVDLLRNDLKDLVEKFVRQYRAANDREEGRGKREAFAPR
jgi:hypothetical protein